MDNRTSQNQSQILQKLFSIFCLMALISCAKSFNTTSSEIDGSGEALKISNKEYVSNWTLLDKIPTDGRSNPYQLQPDNFLNFQSKGQIHALIYPVSITGVLLPERPIQEILDNKTWNPIKGILNEVFKSVVGVNDFGGLLDWVGLKKNSRGDRPGYSEINKDNTKLFTMSCATCHSDQLFGVTVFGMTKRFPRANEFFVQGGKALNYYNKFLFETYTGATKSEMYWLDRSITNLKSVGFKKPVTLGLDTSLAQVALSLKKREPNEWADKSTYFEKRPRPDDILDHDPGDSKPAVWWNVKYKNRWLSDGSVISGNPIYTNLLWNEIGRGTDLHELSDWLNENETIIKELTTAVFSAEAPRIEAFFEAERIPKNQAIEGEKIFNKSCSKCHGVYEKNWSRPEFANQPWSKQIKTFRVTYPQPTPVIDVGTDPYRYLSMQSLEILNDLQISKNNKIIIQPQKGYVPPPLVGIWARWPYMHNNAIPNLCALLSPAKDRPKSYYAIDPNNRDLDFDFECNGYPERDRKNWSDEDKIYRTDIKGMSSQGHDEGIFIINGKQILSNEDKFNLIKFLQTL